MSLVSIYKMISSKENLTATEEDEPKFKYQRLTNDLKNIVNKDVITACAVHPKVVILFSIISLLFFRSGYCKRSFLVCHYPSHFFNLLVVCRIWHLFRASLSARSPGKSYSFAVEPTSRGVCPHGGRKRG